MASYRCPKCGTREILEEDFRPKRCFRCGTNLIRMKKVKLRLGSQPRGQGVK